MESKTSALANDSNRVQRMTQTEYSEWLKPSTANYSNRVQRITRINELVVT